MLIVGIALLLAGCYFQPKYPTIRADYPGWFSVVIEAGSQVVVSMGYQTFEQDTKDFFAEPPERMRVNCTKATLGDEFADLGLLELEVYTDSKSIVDRAEIGDCEAVVEWHR